MAQEVIPVNPKESAAPAAAKPVKSTGGGGGGGGGYTAATTISSLEDLKTKAPKLFKAMMQGIAMQIISQMRKGNENIKKTRQEYERNAS